MSTGTPFCPLKYRTPGSMKLSSDKKRVLFPTDTPPRDDFSDVRILSSPETSSPSSPEHNLTDDDIIESFSVSPTIHKGIENLLACDNASDSSVQKNENDHVNSNRKSGSDIDLVKTPWSEKQFSFNPQITPCISTGESIFSAPLKNTSIEIDEEDVNSSTNSISTSSFYGSNPPTIELVRKLRLSRLLDHSKVKAKLFDDVKRSKKSRSRSSDSILVTKTHIKSKSPKLFPGVGHGIKRPNSKLPKKHIKTEKRPNIVCTKEKKKKQAFCNLKSTKWDYKVTQKKPDRVELNDDVSYNRKFFHSTVHRDDNKKRTYEGNASSSNKRRKLYSYENGDKDGFESASALLEFFEEDDTNDGFKTEQNNVSSIIKDLEVSIFDEEEFLPRITKQDADKDKQDFLHKYSYIVPTRTDSGFSFNAGNHVLQQLTSNEDSGNEENSHIKIPSKSPKKNKSPTKENRSPTKEKIYPIFNKRSFGSLSPLKASTLQNIQNQSSQKRKKFAKVALDEKQYLIDAGQKKFGNTECPTCKMVYYIGDLADEKRHHDYHTSKDVFKYKAWKNENIVGLCDTVGYIILVRWSDSKQHVQKVQSIIKHTENEMGSWDSLSSEWKAYMYIYGDTIAGLLIAEPVIQAYRAISSENDLLLHSEESYDVKCGINRIWTRSEFRHRGIATSLLNCLRKNFVFGEFLSMDHIAFSTVTGDGHEFAKKYTAREDYLIYTTGIQTV